MVHIDAFVDRIVFDKGVFSWYLNPKLGNETFKIDTSDFKKSMLKAQKKTLLANPSTGCDCTKVGENLIEGVIHLFNMSFDYEQALAYRKNQGVYLRSNQWYDLEAEVWIVI